MPRTRILIVDDHPGFRAGARTLLAAEGFDIVGEAADGMAAISEARRVRPDVVLLDVQLPDIDGFDVARRLIGGVDPPLVVMISSRDASAYGPDLERSGLPFVFKLDLSPATLRSAIGEAG